LGDEFKLSVNDALQKLKEKPQFFGFCKRPFREVSVNKFPYTIVFEISDTETIVFISAIYHTSRNPKKKYRR